MKLDEARAITIDDRRLDLIFREEPGGLELSQLFVRDVPVAVSSTDRRTIEHHHAAIETARHDSRVQQPDAAARVDDLELAFHREARRRGPAHDHFLRAVIFLHRLLPGGVPLPDAIEPRLAIGERAEIGHRQRVTFAKFTQVRRVEGSGSFPCGSHNTKDDSGMYASGRKTERAHALGFKHKSNEL